MRPVAYFISYDENYGDNFLNDDRDMRFLLVMTQPLGYSNTKINSGCTLIFFQSRSKALTTNVCVSSLLSSTHSF